MMVLEKWSNIGIFLKCSSTKLMPMCLKAVDDRYSRTRQYIINLFLLTNFNLINSEESKRMFIGGVGKMVK